MCVSCFLKSSVFPVYSLSDFPGRIVQVFTHNPHGLVFPIKASIPLVFLPVPQLAVSTENSYPQSMRDVVLPVLGRCVWKEHKMTMG